MYTNIQIQTLKSQIENIKLQIDNIEMQNNQNNMTGLFNYDNQIGEQLLNLSIQMFNAGIQTFNTGKSNNIIGTNLDKYYIQLSNISNQINSIIDDHNKQKQMMEQMQVQMQQMQQMQMQQMYMQQMQMQKENMQKLMESNTKIEVKFSDSSKGTKYLLVNKRTTISELLKQYKDKIYGSVNKKLMFLYKGLKLDKSDRRKIEDVLDMEDKPPIVVMDEAYL